MVRLILTVEAELQDEEVFDFDSLITDLEGEVMKVKSGAYENQLSGNIVKIEVARVEDGVETLKDLFVEHVDEPDYEVFPERLLSGLEACQDSMSDDVCSRLSCPVGSTFAAGVLRVKELASIRRAS